MDHTTTSNPKPTLAEWLEKNMNESDTQAKMWKMVISTEIENTLPSSDTFNRYLQYQAHALAWHRAYCEHSIFNGSGKYLGLNEQHDDG